MAPSHHSTLGLLAKWPRAGRVKTRLAAETSPQWAATLAMALLQDTVQRLADVEARRILAFAPADAEAGFADLVKGRFALQPQSDGDLGQRMDALLASRFSAGAKSA